MTVFIAWVMFDVIETEGEVWKTFTDQENSAGMSGIIFDISLLYCGDPVTQMLFCDITIWEVKTGNRRERRNVINSSSMISGGNRHIFYIDHIILK